MISKNQDNKRTYISEQINNINNIVPNNKKIDKFSMLNDKINSLTLNNNSKKFKTLIETKIIEVNDNFNKNIESLEQKYDILNEQIGKFSKMLN